MKTYFYNILIILNLLNTINMQFIKDVFITAKSNILEMYSSGSPQNNATELEISETMKNESKLSVKIITFLRLV